MAQEKGISRDSAFYPAIVQFIRDSIQTVFNITKAITLGKLSKAPDIKMIPTREIANSKAPLVSGNTFIEFVFWHHRQKLC